MLSKLLQIDHMVAKCEIDDNVTYMKDNAIISYTSIYVYVFMYWLSCILIRAEYRIFQKLVPARNDESNQVFTGKNIDWLRIMKISGFCMKIISMILFIYYKSAVSVCNMAPSIIENDNQIHRITSQVSCIEFLHLPTCNFLHKREATTKVEKSIKISKQSVPTYSIIRYCNSHDALLPFIKLSTSNTLIWKKKKNQKFCLATFHKLYHI